MEIDQLQKIQNVIKEEYLSKNQTKIEENDIDDKGNPISMCRDIIGHKDIEYRIYRFDPNQEKLFPYFCDIKGLNKICDYIIFAERKDLLCIFLIELKGSAGSPEKQLDISEGFVKFILNRAESINTPIDKEIIIRKIGIKDTRSREKTEIKFYENFSYNSKSYALIQGFKSLRLAVLIDAPIDQ